MPHVRIIIAVAAMPLVLWLFVPVASNGQQLQSKIEQKRRAIAAKKKRERVLTTTIEGYSRRIDVLRATSRSCVSGRRRSRRTSAAGVRS